MIRLRFNRLMTTAAIGLASLIASSCGILGGGSSLPNQDFTPSQVEEKPVDDYLRQLGDLPLRFYEAGRWHMEIMQPRDGKGKPAVREAYLLRDPSAAAALRQPRPTDPNKVASWNARISEASKKDTILVVFDDLTIVSLAARTFTFNWSKKLEKRVTYKPIMTRDSIFFIDSRGEYQRLDRYTGEITQVRRFGTGFYPNAQPAANGSHVFIPTTNANAVEGRPDTDLSNTVNALVWHFPSEKTGSAPNFGMVQSQPIADENNIYFTSNDNHLYCLRASDGKMIWREKIEDVGIIRTRPTLHNGVIYVGTDSQFIAVSIEGKIVWSFTPEADEVFEGDIYVMDNQVIARTAKVILGDADKSRNRNLQYGRTTQETFSSDFNTEPSRLISLSFSNIEGTRVVRGPRKVDWSLDNMKQRVLLRTSQDLFIAMDEWEIPYSRTRQEQLRESRKVVRDNELRRYTRRVVQVLDPKTGLVRKHQGVRASYTMDDFPFVMGSQDETDLALYFVTKDGHVFKGFELTGERRE